MNTSTSTACLWGRWQPERRRHLFCLAVFSGTCQAPSSREQSDTLHGDVNSAHLFTSSRSAGAVITPDLLTTMSGGSWSVSLFQMLFKVRKPTATTVGSALSLKSAPKSSRTTTKSFLLLLL